MKGATLYYDGQCPLCLKEMDKLRRLADDTLELQDIHTLEEGESLPARESLLASLHLRTGDEKLLVGLDANVEAWQHTRLGFLWRWLRWPLVKPLADRLYDRWARWRFARLYRAAP